MRAAGLSPILLLMLGSTAGASSAAVPEDFTSLSLEELSDVRVVSVSRREERLADAPASIFVITADDLRRSGARSLPEALRLAPNLHVTRQSQGAYTVTARGFSGNLANKQLVMIDGRTIYTPLYSGVFWDAQYLPIENIDRIEVVGGPGGTLWGTNAVNGVINVITKAAAATTGALAEARWGQQQSGAAFRYGAATAQGAWRAYGMADSMPSGRNMAGAKLGDAWHRAQFGWRNDWRSGADSWTVQGDAYRAGKGQVATASLPRPQEAELRGANLLARFTHTRADGGSINVLAYYDRTERQHTGTFGEKLDMVDLQALYNWAPQGGHALAAGAEYRFARDAVTNISGLAFHPTHTTLHWVSIYGQDTWTLSEQWKLTAGLRLESNGYTGAEWLPNARLAWQPAPDTLWWGALSRTIRAPSRLDRDIYSNSPGGALEGGPGFKSELARVLELGYKRQLGKHASFSITAYRALYDRLRSLVLTRPRVFIIANAMQGQTRGVEAWGSYQLTPDWRLSAGVSALHEKFTVIPGALITRESYDPPYMAQLRSSLTLAEGRDLDLTLRRVAALRFTTVPAYTALDVHLNWRLRPGLDLSLGASNALDREHTEFGTGTAASRLAVGRGAYVRLISRF